MTTTVTLTHNANDAPVSLTSLNVTPVNITPVVTPVNVTPINDRVYERLCMASTSQSPLPIRKILSVEKVRKSSLPNLDLSESTYECLFPNSSHNEQAAARNDGTTERLDGQNNRLTNGIERSEVRSETVRNGINGRLETNRVLVNIDTHNRGIRSNVERSLSQNAYDVAPTRRRDVVQNFSPKREVKIGMYII